MKKSCWKGYIQWDIYVKSNKWMYYFQKHIWVKYKSIYKSETTVVLWSPLGPEWEKRMGWGRMIWNCRLLFSKCGPGSPGGDDDLGMLPGEHQVKTIFTIILRVICFSHSFSHKCLVVVSRVHAVWYYNGLKAGQNNPVIFY